MRPDRTGLPAPEPELARMWLGQHGWAETRRLGDIASLFGRGDENLLVPLAPDSPDFWLRWMEMLDQLAHAEESSPSAIALAISNEGSDVAEFRVIGDGLLMNTIPLLDAQQLLSSVRQMVAASANAAVQPRGYFGHSIPGAVHDHTRSVRMGQTRAGSYIVPIISPIPVLNPTDLEDPDEAALFASRSYVPFARQSMTRLATGLVRLRELSSTKTAPSTKHLNESVGEGVSFELCDGLARALEPDSISDIHVTFTWSSQITADRSRITEVAFSKPAAEPLRRMSERLRGNAVVGEQILIGLVTDLHHDVDDEYAKVTIKTLINDRARPVSMFLKQQQVPAATQAFEQRTQVRVSGRLEREAGKPMRLSEVTQFGPLDALFTGT